MRVDEVQLPSSELLPAAEGSVSELLCSRLVHPLAMAAARDNTTTRVFFYWQYPLSADSQPRRTLTGITR